MSYDSHRGRVVLFGGSDSYGIPVTDTTWEWDGNSWQSFSFVPGPRPSGYSNAMVYDESRRRTVLHFLRQTWEWNGIVWTLRATAGPDRDGLAMAYDSIRAKAVLFGGYGSGANRMSDTWEWDGTSWVQVATSGPGPCNYPAMAFDKNRGRTVLYRETDTWEWDGNSWNSTVQWGPSLVSASLVFDQFSGRTVLYGGSTSNLSSLETNTWSWDGATWSQLSSVGPQRIHFAMAYDAQRRQVVMFGGTNNWNIPTPPSFAETWIGAPVSFAGNFGSGCGNPALGLYPAGFSRPTLGSVGQVDVINAPSSLAFVLLGWDASAIGSSSLPLSLAQFGMPGCDLLQSADASLTGVPYPSFVRFSLPIPNWASLIGTVVYLQGWAPAPSANAGNTIFSNGVYWRIGSY